MPAARRALDGRRHARRRPRPRAARRGDRAGNGRRRRFRPRAARRGDGTALKPIPAARRLANGNCRRHCDLRRHRPRAARLGDRAGNRRRGRFRRGSIGFFLVAI